jgi:hypothetical protein
MCTWACKSYCYYSVSLLPITLLLLFVSFSLTSSLCMSTFCFTNFQRFFFSHISPSVCLSFVQFVPSPPTYFYDVKIELLIVIFMFYSSTFPIILYSIPSTYFIISGLHLPSPVSLEFVAPTFVRKYRVSKFELRRSSFQIICSGLIRLSSKYLTMPILSYYDSVV